MTFALIVFTHIQAQDPGVNTADSTKVEEKKEKKPKKDFKRIFIGGGVGLGFYSGGGSVNVAPIIGYNVTKRLQVGARVTYWRVWQTLEDPLKVKHKQSDNMYALGVFSRLIVWKGLYAHVEPEYMNRGSFASNNWEGNRITGYSLPATKRVDVFNFYVGGGFYQGFSGNSGMFIQLLWNLNQTSDSFYANPALQIGFAF